MSELNRKKLVKEVLTLNERVLSICSNFKDLDITSTLEDIEVLLSLHDDDTLKHFINDASRITYHASQLRKKA